MIEILMVLLVISILIGVATPFYWDFDTDAREITTKQKIIEIKKAIIGESLVSSTGQFISHGFFTDLNQLPNSLTELTSIGSHSPYNPFTKRGWNGPYIQSNSSDWNKDAWGEIIQYSKTTKTIFSCGVDKTCNNGDDLSVSW